MTHHSTSGFESDAAYFDLIAGNADSEQDRKALRRVAKTYRMLAKDGIQLGSRVDHWAKRAEECRTLAEQFNNETRRAQLTRLADTYDMLAEVAEQIGL